MTTLKSFSTTLAFAVLWTIIVAGIVWFVFRPFAEEAVLGNQATSMHLVASYAVSLVETSLDERTSLSDAAAQHLAARPSEGEVTLRSLLERRPDALSARVHSAQVTDELLIQSTRRSAPLPEIQDAEWASYGGSDSTSIAFVGALSCDSVLLATRTRFRLHNNDFSLTMFWDARDVCRILSRLPAGDEALVSVNAGTDIRWKNWRPDSISLIDRQRVREPFNKVRLELDVAAPTTAVVGRIRTSMGAVIVLVLFATILPAIRKFRSPK